MDVHCEGSDAIYRRRQTKGIKVLKVHPVQKPGKLTALKAKIYIDWNTKTTGNCFSQNEYDSRITFNSTLHSQVPF